MNGGGACLHKKKQTSSVDYHYNNYTLRNVYIGRDWLQVPGRVQTYNIVDFVGVLQITKKQKPIVIYRRYRY